MKIKRKTAYLYFLINILFFNILQTYSNDSLKSTVKGIFVEFELKRNQDNRKYALQKSYLIGLERYLDWITVSSQADIRDLLTSIEPSNLVTSYSIESESFLADKYSALITVNFDIYKIEKLLDKKNIKYYAGMGPRTLVLPLMSYNNQLVLWDDPNPWFQSWIERPIDGNLTNFIIPEGDLEDLIIINAEDTRNLNFKKIKKISLKYGVKKVVVPFLKISEVDGKVSFTLRCFDGISKETLNIDITKQSESKNFNILLFDILNSFAKLYDDYWVYDNLEKIDSQTLIEARFTYENFKDWIFIKNIIKNSDNVNYFNLINLSTNESSAILKTINENKFLAELENNNLSIKRNSNFWNIKKYF